MRKIEERFPLDSPVCLPKDTKILIPDTNQNRTNATSYSSNGSNKILVVSNSKVTYLAISSDLRKPLELLLHGRTVGEALQHLEQTSPLNARERMHVLLTHIAMRKFYEDALPEEYLPESANLHFYVTNRCNLRCDHCYMSSGKPLPSGEMSKEERNRVLELFSEIYPRGKVTFSGGEPLMCADIFDLLLKARELGLHISFYTNGLLISRSNVEKVVELSDLIQISLDGATSRVNDAVRGRGTFRRILRSIRLVDKVVAARKNRVYHVSFTLMPINSADIRKNLPSLLRRLDLKGRHQITISGGTALGRAAKNPKMFSTFEAMSKTQDDVIKDLALRGVYQLPLFSNNRFSRTCGLGETVTITADGAIYPCSLTEQPSVGNVRDRDSKRAMQGVRKYIKFGNVDSITVCRRCSLKCFCNGICRLTNLKETGRFDIVKCTKAYKNEQIRSLIRKYESFWISATGTTGPI